MRNLFIQNKKLDKGKLILILIFFFALVIRIWGINFGLKYNEYFHPDENTIVSKAIYVAKHLYYLNSIFVYPRVNSPESMGPRYTKNF